MLFRSTHTSILFLSLSLSRSLSLTPSLSFSHSLPLSVSLSLYVCSPPPRSEAKKTKVKRKTNNPQFEEVFYFEVSNVTCHARTHIHHAGERLHVKMLWRTIYGWNAFKWVPKGAPESKSLEKKDTYYHILQQDLKPQS